MRAEIAYPDTRNEILTITLEINDKALSLREIRRMKFGGDNIKFPTVRWEGQTENGYQYQLVRSEASRKKNQINLEYFGA